MSSIHFKSIQIHNFMSYENATIRLDNSGYILVSGENRNPDDSATSNGCGKSTIFNAIAWALTGKTVSGAKDVSNIYLDGETYCELMFDVDRNEYTVRRAKSPSSLKIYVNGEDRSGKGIRDSEKLLEEYLPDITDSLINSVIILGQGLPQRFTNNTPSGRKEVLEELSKSDFMIEDLKSKLSDRREMLNGNLRVLEDERIRNTSSAEMVEHQLQEEKGELSNLPSKKELTSRLTIASLKVKECETERKKLDVKSSALNEKLKNLNGELLAIEQDKKEELFNSDLEDTEDLFNLIFETDLDIKTRLAEITKLDSITDVCPTCGQKLPDVHKIDTKALKEELENIKNDYESYKQSYETICNENDRITSEIEERYSVRSCELVSEIEATQSELTELTSSLSSDCIDRLTEANKELSEVENLMSVRESTEKSLKEKIKELEEELAGLTEKNVVIDSKIDRLNRQLEINSKMSTIVKRDFRGFLLKNVIDYIDGRCKHYSSQVFGTDRFDFKLDGNNISITYDGKEYELLSGGEKQKADVILQFSLRDMLCSYLNFSSNILVLDEITDSLDEVGAQKVFDLISNNLTDVETVYIISHHTDFSIPVDGEIRVVKGVDKISRIA